MEETTREATRFATRFRARRFHPPDALELSRWLRQAAADVEDEGPADPDGGELEDQHD